jgi:hypothetical protein
MSISTLEEGWNLENAKAQRKSRNREFEFSTIRHPRTEYEE